MFEFPDRFLVGALQLKTPVLCKGLKCPSLISMRLPNKKFSRERALRDATALHMRSFVRLAKLQLLLYIVPFGLWVVWRYLKVRVLKPSAQRVPQPSQILRVLRKCYCKALLSENRQAPHFNGERVRK